MQHLIDRWAGLLALLLWGSTVLAQTTAFTYQGRLTDGSNVANGSYDFQLALFDSSSGGTQIGSTLMRSAVTVSGGVFSVQLDFGVNAFPGADRFLEIGVRPSGGGSFTVLSPRQQISSSPYAIRTLNATQADALSSACTACVQDSQINSVAGSKVSGTIPVASVPSGSTSYIQNTGSQQSSANFNISGNGTLGGNLQTSGRIGIGTTSPLHRLGISGGPPWTADFWGGALDLENASAIGWRGNSSGFRFGIGHTNAGLAFFRAVNELGTTGAAPSYDFLINNAGEVGIGSSGLAPSLTGAKLTVEGGSEAAVFGRSDSSFGVFAVSTNSIALVAMSSNSSIIVQGYDGASPIFHITKNGTYVAGSDFAEALPARGDRAGYEPGDVLVVSTRAPGHVEKASRPYDARVAGIYSTRPGMLGADKQGTSRVDADEVPVAIVGIVPTKVSTENGPIKIGDLLTTSRTPGYAMRCGNRLKCIGAIVGKAMEPLKDGKGISKVLVTLR